MHEIKIKFAVRQYGVDLVAYAENKPAWDGTVSVDLGPTGYNLQVGPAETESEILVRLEAAVKQEVTKIFTHELNSARQVSIN